MKLKKTKMTLLSLISGMWIVTPCISDDSKNEKINFVSWGGAYTMSQVKACIEPYEKATGQKFNVIDYNGGLAEVKTQVESGNVQWDVVDENPYDAIRGCDEGLFVELDHSIWNPAPDGTSAIEDYMPNALGDCYVGTVTWSTVAAFDLSKIVGDEKPKSIADFWDLEKFPGRRGMKKNPEANLEWALMADGVPNQDIYKVLATKEGQDRAFKKLDEIKDHIIWWEAGSQPPQMLADGEALMTSAYNGRLFNAMFKEGKPFKIMWNSQIIDLETYVIVKGAAKKGSAKEKAIMDFLKFCTSTEVLADETNYISYGPLRKSSMNLINPDIIPHLPTAPDNFKVALIYDSMFWADNVDDLTERFHSWLMN